MIIFRQTHILAISLFVILIVFTNSCSSSRNLQPKTTVSEEAPTSSISPIIRVGLSSAPLQQISFNGSYELVLEEATYELDESIETLQIRKDNGLLTIEGGKRFFSFDDAAKIKLIPKAQTALFKLNEYFYSGNLEIYYDGDELVSINELPLEKYLIGVVPSEIPTAQSDFREAVFAQAIAARSYAMYRMEKPTNPNFHLWSDERDQVYKGVEKVTELAKTSVENTRGMALTESGKPAPVFYHASSGGVLERETPAPDVYKGNQNDNVSPYYRWVITRSAEVIIRNLERENKLDATLVNNWIENGYDMTLEVIDRTASDRVKSLKIVINAQEFVIEKFAIRRVLGDEAGKILPSNLFLLKQSPANPDSFYIVGAGAGHGLGMSQWGAIGMSLNGHSYKEILSFYYPKFSLSQQY